MSERWLPVAGWNGFEVSDLGRVRSLTRTVDTVRGPRTYQGRVIRLANHIHGYKLAAVTINSIRYNRSVHSLVMEAFVGPCPPGLEVCHNDGKPSNNVLSNLRYDTRSANMMDAVRMGRHNHGRRTHCPRQHPLIDPNLSGSSKRRGGRNCLACSRTHSRFTHARRFGRVLEMSFKKMSDIEFDKIMSKGSVAA